MKNLTITILDQERSNDVTDKKVELKPIKRIFLTPTVGAIEGRWYDLEVRWCRHCPNVEMLRIVGDHTYCIVCLGCHAQGPKADDVFEAVTAWNNHPIEDALKEENAELLAMMDADAFTIGVINKKVEELEGENALLKVALDNATNEKSTIVTTT